MKLFKFIFINKISLMRKSLRYKSADDHALNCRIQPLVYLIDINSSLVPDRT